MINCIIWIGFRGLRDKTKSSFQAFTWN